jgi:predicted phage baseplate assembly protein
VTNPLPAAGAAPPDDVEQARAKAPVRVLLLDRLVSLQDYEEFARAFAGIGKARAAVLWNGQTKLLHLTIAGVREGEINSKSDLHRSLLEALGDFHDPLQPVRLDSYTPQRFYLQARVLVDLSYLAAAVLENARATLLRTFSFEQRSLGQPVTASEIIAVMQRIPGVVAVDLEHLYLNGKPRLEDYVPAELASWDPATGEYKSAQLLTLSDECLKLEEMLR